MRVLVTGGTGFVGAHSARAIAAGGHDVRLLVRRVDRIAPTVGALGLTDVEHVVGDMTDPAAVDAAVAGCDAVLHCAATVSLSAARAAEVASVNPLGVRTVVEAATRHRLDPIVVVSSANALFTPGMRAIDADAQPGPATTGYTGSKAEAERIARSFQAEGAPVVITYPGGVLGPPVGDNFGEAAEGVVTFLRAGALVVPGARLSMIDVRDLAAIHAAVMAPGRGPRRVMCGGHSVTMRELAVIYRRLTGRRMPVLACPPALLRAIGRAVDALGGVRPVDSPYTAEAMETFTRWPPTVDSDLTGALGVTLRPLAETLADTIAALARAGRVTLRQAGAAGSAR